MIDIEIRAEAPGEASAIHDLTRRAFAGKPHAGGNEQDLTDALRAGGQLVLSLVALHQERVIGQVSFSAGVAADGAWGWFALGPIAVEPGLQRQGVGGALIREGLARLQSLGARGCVLIGSTAYYSRHGFVARPDLCPSGEPAAHYMVHPLNGCPADQVVGFQPLFHEPGAA